MGRVNSKSILDVLDNYYKNNPESTDKGEFRQIEDILKSKEFQKYEYKVDDVINAVYCDLDLKFSVRGNRIRPKPAELNCEPSVILSKKMAALLRHGLSNYGLEIINGSFVRLSDMLKLKAFNGFTEEDVASVVNTNDKKRYEIVKDKSGSLIRAFQGHSVQVADIGLTPFTNAEELPRALHGTFYSNWESIKQNGLSKMGRNHIHLCSVDQVKHMRDGAQMIIELDTQRAIKDGIHFYKSMNGVILCDGENGILKPDYFIRCWDINTNEVLLDNAVL